jgi:hypothetical protein
MTRLRNEATGLYLDSNDQGKAYSLGGSLESNWQNWVLVHANGREFTLRNAQTDLFLDSNGEGRVYTLQEAHNEYQRWYIDNNRIINVATGRALNTNGERNLETLPPSNSPNQKWHLE